MFKANEPATILAQKMRNGTAALGVAVLLSDLSNLLGRELPTRNSHLALFRRDGTPIASDLTLAIREDNGNTRLRMQNDFPAPIRLGIEKYRNGVQGDSIRERVEGREWLLSVNEFVNGDETNYFMVLAIPRNEILSDANDFLLYALLALGGILFIFAPAIFLVSRRITRPLLRMEEQTHFARGIGLEREKTAASGVQEIDALEQGILSLHEYLGKILAVVRTIGTERDMTSLMHRVFQETVAISGADGGGIVFLDDKGEFQSEGYYYWIDSEIKPVVIPRNDEAESFQALQRFARAFKEKQPIRNSFPRDDPKSRIAAFLPVFDDPQVKRLDTGTIVLRDRKGVDRGLLTFFQKVRAEEEALSDGQMVFWESLAAAVAMVVETQSLIKAQYDLRDALIHILAGAIDAKSPYTGGHCARVPIIFQMLLEAACDSREGPFAEFKLDEDEWEEARLAGWLHDCGKVTTPEYVMDKATKLETLYDRIHEIRTRFEVLKRDAEIASLRATMAGADPKAERARLDAELAALDDDFAFVASCNSGDKFMAAADYERLAAIGGRVWRRTLDKSLGVSRDEEARMKAGKTSSTPRLEPLLADNPEHIIPRGPKDMLDPDNSLGFKLTIPEVLYNRGELYNLSIPRGTLTPEERYKINDHITQTIIMLERMPLPSELANMPEIACAHHETMDGRGYPRQLTREEMSWKARMMAVADIFEALTACDRPYKNSKTVSEALKIMEKMKADNHIDPDVYDLFLKTGIPQSYAKQYLKPEQLDLMTAENVHGDSSEKPPPRGRGRDADQGAGGWPPRLRVQSGSLIRE